MSAKEIKSKYIWPAIGQESLFTALEKTLEAGKLSQAYAFVGPDGVGKREIALAFAHNLVVSSGGQIPDQGSQSYSDLMIVRREEGKKNISIDQIRDLIHRLSMSSFLGSYKIGIVEEAESLSLDAANALLKTLEEPRDGCIIILVASSLSELPPTIMSRLAIWRILPAKREAVYDYLLSLGAKREAAKEISALSWGRPGLAKRLLEEEGLLDLTLHPIQAWLDHVAGNRLIGDRELDEWLGKGGFNAESEAAIGLIVSLEQAARELALVDLGLEELSSFPRFRDEFTKLAGRFQRKGLSVSVYASSASRALEEARRDIAANVSARRAISAALAAMAA
jgi:hypothetical protein